MCKIINFRRFSGSSKYYLCCASNIEISIVKFVYSHCDYQFLFHCNKKDNIDVLMFQVLVLEPTKVYKPSYIAINEGDEEEEMSVRLWRVAVDKNCRVMLKGFFFFFFFFFYLKSRFWRLHIIVYCFVQEDVIQIGYI